MTLLSPLQQEMSDDLTEEEPHEDAIKFKMLRVSTLCDNYTPEILQTLKILLYCFLKCRASIVTVLCQHLHPDADNGIKMKNR